MVLYLPYEKICKTKNQSKPPGVFLQKVTCLQEEPQARPSGIPEGTLPS